MTIRFLLNTYLGFRNKQLEFRVAALQEELVTSEARKKDKKRNPNDKNETQQLNSTGGGNKADMSQDALIFEELQKKIMENAELTSLVGSTVLCRFHDLIITLLTQIDDKERSLQLHIDHIKNMEETLEKRNIEHADSEKRLRKDLEILQNRNQELETKLVEAASMVSI